MADIADDSTADAVDLAPAPARPVYPGEAEIGLAAATLTSSGCTSPALAVDDDPATAAVFGVPDAGGLLPVARPVAATRSVHAVGAAYLGLPPNLIDGDSSTTADLYLTGSHQADWFILDLGAEVNVGAVTLTNVTATGGNPLGTWVTDTPNVEPNPGDPGQLTAPSPYPTAAGSQIVFTAPPGGMTGRYLQVRQFELGAATGSVTIGEVVYQPVGPLPRFLRVDWGYDAFISRIRLAFSGPGAGSAGVDYESSLSFAEGHAPPVDIALSYIPVPADGSIHEVVFSPPVLGRGAVFYPDALLGTPSSQSVSLAQFQVYQEISLGVPVMPKPSVTQVRVGCSGAVLTPRAANVATSYPFPQALASVLQSIQGLKFSSASKLARETGGDTVHQINGYETDREIKAQFSVERYDYQALQNLLAGTLVVNPANPATGTQETQYHAPNYTDHLPYFSLVAQSANGDPAAAFVLPKCKIEGNLTHDLERDKATTFDVDFVLFWDFNYTRQDGNLGGIYEMVFNNGGAVALHS